MKILITGGTGLIGKPLVNSLIADANQVIILSRNPPKANLLPNAEIIQWDGCTPQGWGHLLNEVDAVINLAGENIGSFPWSEKRKIQFRQSRIRAGAAIVDAFNTAKARPCVLLQASAVGYYGPQGDELIDESTPGGSDFSARLCVDWEDSTKPVEEMGVRRVVVRTGIVLSSQGGVLPLMALPTRLFVGGSLGKGRQGFPWIHIGDEVAAIRFLLENENLKGVFNLSAPNPVSSIDFIRSLAKVLHRPCWFPTPAFALKLILSEMSTLLLDGQFMIPKRLVEAGFKFSFTNVELALRDLYRDFS
jgi:uncharacterized protein (TIGR01777 family)